MRRCLSEESAEVEDFACPGASTVYASGGRLRLIVVNELLRDRRAASAASPSRLNQTFKTAACAAPRSSAARWPGCNDCNGSTLVRSFKFPRVSERNPRGAPVDYPHLRGMYVRTSNRALNILPVGSPKSCISETPLRERFHSISPRLVDFSNWILRAERAGWTANCATVTIRLESATYSRYYVKQNVRVRLVLTMGREMLD